MKTKRNIIKIDREKCIGCGACADSCMQNVIEMRDGKAEVVRPSTCDGLGKCLAKCPVDAITLTEEEIEAPAPKLACGCPGTMVRDFAASPAPAAVSGAAKTSGGISYLRQWPVQLHLVPADAPYLAGCDLLICADCVMAAYGAFQEDFLRGRRLLIACPKLDNTDSYLEKLTAIFANNAPRSITVLYMQVPCCAALKRMVETALQNAHCTAPYEAIKITLDGARAAE